MEKTAWKFETHYKLYIFRILTRSLISRVIDNYITAEQPRKHIIYTILRKLTKLGKTLLNGGKNEGNTRSYWKNPENLLIVYNIENNFRIIKGLRLEQL